MAGSKENPLGHKNSVVNAEAEDKNGDGHNENLWSSLLGEVQTSRSSQLPASKSLLVLGDKESGKTTLIAKLQGNEDPKKGSGLEYGYIDVRDEYRDDHTRLSHWILDGDITHANLLNFALTENNYEDTTVVINVSMTAPWNVMDQLQNWASLLQDHIDKLPISAEQMQEYQKRSLYRWQTYTEPGDEIENSLGGSPTKRPSRTVIDCGDELEAPPEGTLSRNLGLDLIVVVNKTDFIIDLEKDYDYKDEHFDFIQQAVRKFCLQYGASLFYTSVKEDKNCDLLYKYLVHRIYHFPFKTPALVVEKDAVFIPAGWDNDKKIAILYENMHSVRPDQYYTDVIARPMSMVGRRTGPGPGREVEVVAEEEQQFLSRQQQYLAQGIPQTQGGPMPPGVQKTPDRKVVGSPGVQGSPKKIDPSAVKQGAATTSEGVLANFFNSLLSKKTGGLAGGQPGPVVGLSPGAGPSAVKPSGGADDYKAAVRSDAAAELDRLTRNQKKSLTSQEGGSLQNNNSEC